MRVNIKGSRLGLDMPTPTWSAMDASGGVRTEIGSMDATAIVRGLMATGSTLREAIATAISEVGGRIVADLVMGDPVLRPDTKKVIAEMLGACLDGVGPGDAAHIAELAKSADVHPLSVIAMSTHGDAPPQWPGWKAMGIPDDLRLGLEKSWRGPCALNLTGIGQHVTALPGGLVIGALMLNAQSMVRHIPDGTVILGDAGLKDSRIESIGQGVKIDGHLDLRGCHRWDGLIPEGVSVSGGLSTDSWVFGKSLAEWRTYHPNGERPLVPAMLAAMASGMTFTEALAEFEYDIEDFHQIAPAWLAWAGKEKDGHGLSKELHALDGTVNGLANKALNILPEGFIVRGSLDLRGELRAVRIYEFPKGIRITGSLHANDAPIMSLPEGMRVDGSCWLNGCWDLTRLPKGFCCGASLHLEGTRVAELPDDLRCRDSITVSDCWDSVIPPELRTRTICWHDQKGRETQANLAAARKQFPGRR
jgi:hypothetical protein